MELTLLYTPQYNFDSDSKFEDAFNTFKKTILRYDKSKMVKKQSFLKNTAKFIMKTVEDIWELLVVIGKLIYSNLYFIVCLVLYTQTIAFANYEDNAILYFYTILYIPVLFLIVNNKLKKVIIDPKFNLIKESSNLDELLKLELFGYVIQQGRGRNYILFNTDSPIYFVIYSSGKYFTYELTNDNLKVKNAEYLNNLTNTVIEVSDIMEELMKDNKE